MSLLLPAVKNIVPLTLIEPLCEIAPLVVTIFKSFAICDVPSVNAPEFVK